MNIADTVGASQPFGRSGNGKGKRGSRTIIQCRPQTAMMTLDNGATHGKSHSHTVALGGVERVEKAVYSLRVKPDSRILYRQPHPTTLVSLGSDYELPWTILDCVHSV